MEKYSAIRPLSWAVIQSPEKGWGILLQPNAHSSLDIVNICIVLGDGWMGVIV